MDKLTHISLTNCVKELDALEKLILSGQFSYQEIADWVAEISWNLSNVFNRRKYKSDEFQHRLKKLIKETKRTEKQALNHAENDDD